MNKLIGDDDFLARYVTWALWALAIIVCIATITGQIESYNGLYIWFATHHITGIWADFAPLAVDSFTVVGELAIFAGIARHWDWPSRILPWVSAILGICASVAANVGDKVQFHSIPTDLTGAIFPLAGAFGLIIGLGVLKRVARDHTEKKAVKTLPLVLTEEEKEAQRQADKEHLDDTLSRWKREGLMDPPKPEIGSDALGNVYAPVSSLEDIVAGPSMETMERINAEMENRKLKGMDVLIPPRPPVTASTAAPVGVSREEARRRLSDIRLIEPDGLDIHQTGNIPVVT